MKRLLTVLAGLALALAGILAFASPANAESCGYTNWTSASWGRVSGVFDGDTFYGCTQDLVSNGHYVYAKGLRSTGSWHTISFSSTQSTNPNEFDTLGQGCFEKIRLYESGTGKYLTHTAGPYPTNNC